MRSLILAIAAASLLASCAGKAASYNADRQDRPPAVTGKPTEQRKAPNRNDWRPGGPQDTDGKRGEPGCPDCDGGGPYPPGHW